MKDPYAIFNTHIKKCKALVSNDKDGHLQTKKEYVDLRFTSDDIGETFSITFGHMQVALKYKDVISLVEETRNDKQRRS